MTDTAQWAIRDYASFRWPSLNHKARIARMATVLGVGERRARSLYQNEPGVRLRADEMEAIAALPSRKIEEANRNDFADLQARVARLEALLATVEPGALDAAVARQGQGIHGGRRGYVADSSDPAPDYENIDQSRE